MSESNAAEASELCASHVLEYAYKRSLGTVLSRFFTELRDGRIVGIKTEQGKVLVPPSEYDPQTGNATTDEFVEVGPGGVVTSWAWVGQPRESHPLDRPFAFALIQLDKADTALMHVVDAGQESVMSSGMRVTPRWASEPEGRIQDIECFVPEEAS